MSSERWQLVERLYHGALERPAAERPAFLAEACAGDEALATRRAVAPRPALDAGLPRRAGTGTGGSLGGGRRTSRTALGRTAHRCLSPAVAARPRRHGRGLPRARHAARPRRRDQGAAARRSPRDPERLARFEREARLLASLNHPNIGTIHGLEEAEGMRALVLELVEGETLARPRRARAAAGSARRSRSARADRRRARSRARARASSIAI